MCILQSIASASLSAESTKRTFLSLFHFDHFVSIHQFQILSFPIRQNVLQLLILCHPILGQHSENGTKNKNLFIFSIISQFLTFVCSFKIWLNLMISWGSEKLVNFIAVNEGKIIHLKIHYFSLPFVVVANILLSQFILVLAKIFENFDIFLQWFWLNLRKILSFKYGNIFVLCLGTKKDKCPQKLEQFLWLISLQSFIF